MRVVFIASVAGLLSVACATPSTVFVGPPCAKLTSDDDKAKALAPNALMFDNSLDLPLRHRTVHVEYPNGTTHDVVVTSDHQDTSRVVAGCAFGACGALELGLGAFQTNTLNQYVDFGAGAALVASGVLEVLDGWRPDQTTAADFDDGVCSAKPAPAAPLAPATPVAPVAPSENSPSTP